ncbi:MAG: DUF4143 domain-containing protein [bacterium]|nr:DUF4143 domain-containing protein [bacterium]
MAKYLPRIVDNELALRLETFGATLIAGPKWCGKTTTGEQKAKSVIRLQDPDYRDGYLATAKTKPSILLKGATPRLIDEWQMAPVLWDAVRTAVDQRQEEGLFILTGSTSVDSSKIMHTGTGRISRMKMNTMSLFESEESNGNISLKSLFQNPSMDIDGITSELSIEELIFAACRGGWPASILRKTDTAKLMIAKDYISNIQETDISTVDGVQRNPAWTGLILRSYARNVSTLAKKTIIHKDVSANADSMTLATMNAYINALEKLFVIEDIEAWCPAIRSSTTIRSGKKRGFSDPSIPVAVLGLSPDALQIDMKTFGFIFECLCIRDLKIYSQALGGTISYYHDRYDLEADAVLHLNDGRFALIEFKLGSKDIEDGARHLLEIKNLIMQYNAKETQVPLREPELLMVITGGNIAYTRDDGVKVIPIGTLRD